MQTLLGPSSTYSLQSRILFFFKLFQVFIQISLYIYQYFSKFHDSPTETKLHTLDVLRAMSFHLSRTKPFWKSLRLFVAFGNKSRGIFFFFPEALRGVSTCMRVSHALNKLSLPSQLGLPFLRLRQHLQLVLEESLVQGCAGQLLGVQFMCSSGIASG